MTLCDVSAGKSSVSESASGYSKVKMLQNCSTSKIFKVFPEYPLTVGKYLCFNIAVSKTRHYKEKGETMAKQINLTAYEKSVWRVEECNNVSNVGVFFTVDDERNGRKTYTLDRERAYLNGDKRVPQPVFKGEDKRVYTIIADEKHHAHVWHINPRDKRMTDAEWSTPNAWMNLDANDDTYLDIINQL